jgi:hypothetical protein
MGLASNRAAHCADAMDVWRQLWDWLEATAHLVTCRQRREAEQISVMSEIDGERQWLVPHFWKKFELQSRLSLGHLKIEPADAELMITDMLRRFSHIRAELPVNEHSPVYRHFAMLIGNAITAEQHLFAAQKGRVPGEIVDDWSLPGVPDVNHPFINELRKAVSELQNEARGPRAN